MRTLALSLALLAATAVGLPMEARARNLMLVSESKTDSYFVDLDDIQGAKDFIHFRAAPLYRFMSTSQAEQEGYDFTQVLVGLNCQTPHQISVLKVTAFDSTGQVVQSEITDRDYEDLEWLDAPEDTHFGQAWQAVCRDRRSDIVVGDVSPAALLVRVRLQQAGAAPQD